MSPPLPMRPCTGCPSCRRADRSRDAEPRRRQMTRRSYARNQPSRRERVGEAGMARQARRFRHAGHARGKSDARSTAESDRMDTVPIVRLRRRRMRRVAKPHGKSGPLVLFCPAKSRPHRRTGESHDQSSPCSEKRAGHTGCFGFGRIAVSDPGPEQVAREGALQRGGALAALRARVRRDFERLFQERRPRCDDDDRFRWRQVDRSFVVQRGRHRAHRAGDRDLRAQQRFINKDSAGSPRPTGSC